MDTRSRIPSIERRLDQVEHEVHILQENQAALERTVAQLEARGPAAATPERPQAVPEVIFTALARAGAQREARGRPAPAPERPPAASSMPSTAAAEAPSAPTVPSMPASPVGHGPLDLMREADALLPCPQCHRGNPPEGLWCRWCGARLVSTPAISGGDATQAVPGTEGTPFAATPAAEPLPGVLAEAEAVAPAEPPERTLPEVPEPPRARPSFDFLGKSEFWLNKVGIGLLLLGLAYFFKYSIDKGWLNEPVRIGLGLALGTLLLGTGLAFHAQRRHFSQVLLGGSIATYYITGFAAYELFHLVPYAAAFGFMAVVTALAFALAVRQDEAILALIGVAGGLLTPFVLTGPAANVTGLMIYTCVVLAGATAIYFFRGWRSLLWLSLAGGWAVFLLGWSGTVGAGQVTTADRWALQGAALFGLLAFWAVPVLREVYVAHHPERESRPLFAAYPDLARLVANHVYLLVTGVPLITLAFSRLIWTATLGLGDSLDMMVPPWFGIDFSVLVWGSALAVPAFGWLTLGGSAVYGLVAWALRRMLPALSSTHGLLAILLFTLGLMNLLSGVTMIFALAVEALALHYIARRSAARLITMAGHVVAATVMLSSAVRLWVDCWYVVGGQNDTNIFAWVRMVLIAGSPAADPFNMLTASTPGGGAIMLTILGLLAAMSFALSDRAVILVYRNFVHAAVVVWLFEVLYNIPYATGWTMLAWAIYAVLLNVVFQRLPARFTAGDTTTPSHLIFAAAAGLFALNIDTGQAGAWSVFNVKTLLDVAFVAILAGISFAVRPASMKTLYRFAVHMGVLGLLWRELWVLPNGPGLVMLTWALYAVGLHLLHNRWPVRFPEDDTTIPAHLILLLTGGWFILDIVSGQVGEWAVFNVRTLIDAAVVAIVAGMSFFVRPARIVPGYRIAAHAGVLALLWRELGAVPDGPGYVMLAWASYLTFAQYLARRANDQITAAAAHLPSLGVAALLTTRLLYGAPGPTPLVNLNALIDLAVIALALGTSLLVQPWAAAWGYRLAAHLAILGWFRHELVTLENGQALVTVAWGAYAIAVVVGGLWGGRRMPLVYTGIGTLFVVLGKLFLVDLAAIDPLWRVLLFLGFGGMFLWLSYFFQNAISGKPRPPRAPGIGRLHWPGRPAH